MLQGVVMSWASAFRFGRQQSLRVALEWDDNGDVDRLKNICRVLWCNGDLQPRS